MFPIILRGHPVQKWFHNYACVAVASIDDSMFVVCLRPKSAVLLCILCTFHWIEAGLLFYLSVAVGLPPFDFMGTYILLRAVLLLLLLRCMITPEKRSEEAWCRVQTCCGLAHSHTRNDHKNSSLFCRNRYLFTNPLRLRAKFRYKYELMMNS